MNKGNIEKSEREDLRQKSVIFALVSFSFSCFQGLSSVTICFSRCVPSHCLCEKACFPCCWKHSITFLKPLPAKNNKKISLSCFSFQASDLGLDVIKWEAQLPKVLLHLTQCCRYSVAYSIIIFNVQFGRSLPLPLCYIMSPGCVKDASITFDI